MKVREKFSETLSDKERLTDIEFAMLLLRLMGDPLEHKSVQCQVDGRDINFSIAENALKRMTNPFAKKLLLDKITGQ